MTEIGINTIPCFDFPSLNQRIEDPFIQIRYDVWFGSTECDITSTQLDMVRISDNLHDSKIIEEFEKRNHNFHSTKLVERTTTTTNQYVSSKVSLII